MMHNSLERLLGGIADALRQDIAPAVVDDFARRQALAAAEILEQLVSRVQWRAEDLTAVVIAVRPALEAAIALAPEAAALESVREVLRTPLREDADGLLTARDDHLRALAAVQTWTAGAVEADAALAGRLREAATTVLARELDHLELARARVREQT